MPHYIELVNDSRGNAYPAIKIDAVEIEPYLDDLKTALGDDYDRFTGNQQYRDRGAYHLTFAPVFEFQQLHPTEQDMLVGQKVSLDFLGVGAVSECPNQAFFVVVESAELLSLRHVCGLPPKDFHITLGFSERDVHSKRKNAETLLNL